jgi:hypothetical protein
MGPRIPRRRKLVRKDHDELGLYPTDSATVLSSAQGTVAEPALGRHAARHRKTPSAGVTHRSPSPDDMLLPCCGRPLSAVPGRDRVTTDPEQVTCRG